MFSDADLQRRGGGGGATQVPGGIGVYFQSSQTLPGTFSKVLYREVYTRALTFENLCRTDSSQVRGPRFPREYNEHN